MSFVRLAEGLTIMLSMALTGLAGCGETSSSSCSQPLMLTQVYSLGSKQITLYQGDASKSCLRILREDEFVIGVDGSLSENANLEIDQHKVEFGTVNSPLLLEDRDVKVNAAFLSETKVGPSEVVWLSIRKWSLKR